MKTEPDSSFVKHVLLLCLALSVTGVQTEEYEEVLKSELSLAMKHLHSWLLHLTYDHSTKWPYSNVTFNHPRQSPVDLVTSKAYNLGLPPLEIIKNIGHGTQAKFYNNGNSVFVYMNNTPENRPQLQGGPLLNNRFYFEQMHFHWGSEDEWGSEHFINGESFAAETHLVYWNSKYGSFTNASKQDDGLAVLAVFAEGRNRTDNPLLTPLQKVLHNVSEAGSYSMVDTNDAMQWALSALSENNVYYTYPGSLTTEPYSENVIFILLPKPIYLSLDQFDLKPTIFVSAAPFRTIHSSDGGDVKDNKRKLQPLHHRPIIRAYNAIVT